MEKMLTCATALAVLVTCALASHAEGRVAPRRCTETHEDEDAEIIARARTVRRRPRARVSIVSLEAPPMDPNMDAVRRHIASEQELFQGLSRAASRAEGCYQRSLSASPDASGAVLLTITTRAHGLIVSEPTAGSANDEGLERCALEVFAELHTRRALPEGAREAAVIFCPRDRPVCVTGPLAPTPEGVDTRALAAAVSARTPAIVARYRTLGAHAPRGSLVVYVATDATGHLSQLGAGPFVPPRIDVDHVLDLLTPVRGVCASTAPGRHSFAFHLWLGVR